MTQAETIERLGAFDPEGIREHLAAWNGEGDNEQAVNDTIAWVGELRDELVSLISTLEDDEDVAMSMGIAYAENKSRWIGFNTKMNYQIFRTGTPDTNDVFRGNAIFHFITLIGEILNTGDVDKIDGFLAEPLANAA